MMSINIFTLAGFCIALITFPCNVLSLHHCEKQSAFRKVKQNAFLVYNYTENGHAN